MPTPVATASNNHRASTPGDSPDLPISVDTTPVGTPAGIPTGVVFTETDRSGESPGVHAR
eukprot:9489854-Pyramimonas_sp.AAC.1